MCENADLHRQLGQEARREPLTRRLEPPALLSTADVRDERGYIPLGNFFVYIKPKRVLRVY